MARGDRPAVSPARSGRQAVEAVWRIESARIVGTLARLHLKPMKSVREEPEADPLIAIAGGGGVNLHNSMGNAWTADYLKITGELDVDLRSNIAAEARAKIVYERLIDFTDDAGTKAISSCTRSTPGWSPSSAESDLRRDPQDDPASYRPFQTGARFSANARAPSRASSDVKTWPRYGFWCGLISSAGQSQDSRTIAFEAATARGPFAAIRRAISRAASIAGPSQTLFTSPSS